ncbi:GFA family protein [Aestuariicoccus sp. MJ-SS9]|uniref:GFA family protein n=1 Tax=Aestuariicoccus sp. MJ-SS9 TaxID=3079855 RepID=UPI002910ABB6|nr:GFA family protein [Aestuariicoccus sp. MJ-SS9]MDU8910149.1 GFA family protein [Aestuariicoccus sp. MJ-SS9]
MSVVGQCLCGAVRITVADPPGWVGVCHCDMCKRWSGAVFAAFPATDVTIDGPVAEFASSPTSYRAFCGTCGSHLYMRDEGRAERDLMPGLFDAARDWPLKSEIYTDRALCWAGLPGDHKRATQAEYEAKYPSPVGDQT